MTTSDAPYSEAFVWIWLPAETSPIPAGKITRIEDRYVFNYGRTYLENPKAIAIFEQELPLVSGMQEKQGGTEVIHGCLRDSSPDAWGRRVILNKLMGIKGRDADPGLIDELTYLMESGSDRIGALDFQSSPINYIPRKESHAELSELLTAAELVEKGVPLTPELAEALNHGTAIGGARPKVLITDGDIKYIAKFSTSHDSYNIIKAEYIAMQLAQCCGLDVANTKLVNVQGKDILLVERFDRIQTGQTWHRKIMLSSLTLLQLDEMTARYASYQDFAEIIRHKFSNPKGTLRELFGRIVFNILCSNTDDHARNHAAFWNGNQLSLTKAYDICPQLRTGGEATQAMFIHEQNNTSQLITCLKAAPFFLLSESDARSMIDHMDMQIKNHYDGVCKKAQLSEVDKRLFWQRMFRPGYAFQGFSA